MESKACQGRLNASALFYWSLHPPYAMAMHAPDRCTAYAVHCTGCGTTTGFVKIAALRSCLIIDSP